MYLHGFETEIVVVEISVVDDGGIEFFGVGHNDFVRLLRDHRRELVVLGVDVGVEIMDDLGELLLGLLVQVGHSNAAS
jgi:hypothetical protein